MKRWPFLCLLIKNRRIKCLRQFFQKGFDKIRILAIDQAKTTGYAVFENNELVEYGIIDLGKKTDKYENILYFARQEISRLIDNVKADIIVIEDIQQQNQNVSTYKKLAMLMGVLLCLFQENNVSYDIVPPTRWKSFCKIQGRKRQEQKDNTVLFVKERFGLNDVTEDMADAISIGWFEINSLKEMQYES
jgi:Holliday junction resolvasome RuvABC endonuclease subunit